MDPRSNQHQLAPRFPRQTLRWFPSESRRRSFRTCAVCQLGKTQTTNYYMTLLFTCQALSSKRKSGDPYRIRTDVNGVRGRCLNHLTNGPSSEQSSFRSASASRRKLRSASLPFLFLKNLRIFCDFRTKDEGLGTGVAEGFSEPGVSPGYTQLRTGAPSRTRTGDPLIKSQLLYQLS